MVRAALVTLMTGMLLLATAGASDALTLYGSTTGGQTTPSNLYQISPTTGAATFIGPIGFQRVGALDFSPVDGRLYGVGFNGTTVVLITIDVATGAGTQVGPLNLPSPFVANPPVTDIAFRPADGQLFAVSSPANSNSSSPITLLTINTATGAASLIGPLGTTPPGLDGSALAFLGDTLYYSGTSSSNGRLFTVDQSTGHATLVVNVSYPPAFGTSDPRPPGMKFDPVTGILWAIVKADSPDKWSLGTIDRNSGQATFIGVTQNAMDAIAVLPLARVPTLSRKAEGVLGAVIVLAAVWMLRRRRLVS